MNRRECLRRLLQIPASAAGIKLLTRLRPEYVFVDAFPLYSRPTISVDEIRTRMFRDFAAPLARYRGYQEMAKNVITITPWPIEAQNGR